MHADPASAPQAPAAEPVSPYSLLPRFMTGPQALLWCWVAPLLLLLSLNTHAWWVVQGNMDASHRAKALLLGVFSVGSLLLGLIMATEAFVAERRAREPSVRGQLLRGIVLVVVHVAFLWWVIANAEDCLPRNVWAWIYPPERLIFNQFLCAMPPLFLGLLRISATQARGEAGAFALWAALACALGAPLLLYVLASLLWATHAMNALAVLFGACLVLFGIMMFLGVLRLTLQIIKVLREGRHGPEIACVGLLALAVPLAGLLLNRTIPFPVTFQDPAVYAWTVVNAFILGWVSWTRARHPRLNFVLLLLSFPFTAYFFVVFLPYTPLSILAVIVFGLGFLVLAPTFLFALHLGLIARASETLGGTWSGWRRLAIGAACLLLTPGFLTVRGLSDRQALGEAMNHVFTPALRPGDQRFEGNADAARRAILNYRAFREGIRHPFLSDYYEWLVFDSLMLSEGKLAELEAVFVGPAELARAREGQVDPFFPRRGGADRGGDFAAFGRRPGPPPATSATSARPVVRVAEAGPGTCVATVSLSLSEEGLLPSEYATRFRLPSSLVLRGLRLGKPGALVEGRIFERRSALHVYTMIRDTERRDPALLLLGPDGQPELRVYPVIRDTPCVVEVDFLVPASRSSIEAAVAAAPPWDLAAAAQVLASSATPHLSRDPAGTTCITGLDTASLPASAPGGLHLHVIVDRSAGNAFTGKGAEQVAAALRLRFPEASSVSVTLAGRDMIAGKASGDLAQMLSEEALQALPAEGGLMPDQALAKALLDYRERFLDAAGSPQGPAPARPVLVLLSRKAITTLPRLDLFHAWSDLAPGVGVYSCDAAGLVRLLLPGDAAPRPLVRLGAQVRWVGADSSVRFLGHAEAGSLLVRTEAGQWQPLVARDASSLAPAWSQAQHLLAQSQDRRRNPGGSSSVETLAALVASSRQSGVLVSQASYIVVENEAQWRMLELSEKQKLGANEALDFKRTPAPSALWLGLALAGWLGLRRFRRRNG